MLSNSKPPWKPAWHRRVFLRLALGGVIVEIVLTLRSTTEAIANWGLVGLSLQALTPFVVVIGYAAFVIWFAQTPVPRGCFYRSPQLPECISGLGLVEPGC